MIELETIDGIGPKTKELLNKRNELASNTINNLVISIKEPLTEIVNFSNKKINKNS